MLWAGRDIMNKTTSCSLELMITYQVEAVHEEFSSLLWGVWESQDKYKRNCDARERKAMCYGNSKKEHRALTWEDWGMFPRGSE